MSQMPAQPLPGEFPILDIHLPGEPPWQTKVETPSITLGRLPSCEVVLVHASISRQHARLWREGDDFFIEDLGSSNGTFIDGQRIAPHTPQPLPAGAELRLGKVELRLHLPAIEAPAAGAATLTEQVPAAPVEPEAQAPEPAAQAAPAIPEAPSGGTLIAPRPAAPEAQAPEPEALEAPAMPEAPSGGTVIAPRPAAPEAQAPEPAVEEAPAMPEAPSGGTLIAPRPAAPEAQAPEPAVEEAPAPSAEPSGGTVIAQPPAEPEAQAPEPAAQEAPAAPAEPSGGTVIAQPPAEPEVQAPEPEAQEAPAAPAEPSGGTVIAQPPAAPEPQAPEPAAQEAPAAGTVIAPLPVMAEAQALDAPPEPATGTVLAPQPVTDEPVPPSAPAAIPAVLLFNLPDGSQLPLNLDKPELTIGRTPDCDLILNHASISRRHARLLLQPDGMYTYIEDLGSSNGTFLDGERLQPQQPARLMGGELRLGEVWADLSGLAFAAAPVPPPQVGLFTEVAPSPALAPEPPDQFPAQVGESQPAAPPPETAEEPRVESPVVSGDPAAGQAQPAMAAAAPLPAFLGVMKIKLPDGTLQEFNLQKPEITIGRTPGNDLIISHASISRQHARLLVKADGLYIEDLGSSNGTQVRSQRLIPNQAVRVPPGEPLLLGDVAIDLPIPPEDSAPPALRQPLPGRWYYYAGGAVIVLLLLLLLGFGANAMWQRLANRDKTDLPDAVACQQPPMTVISSGGNIYQPGLVPGLPPSAAGLPGAAPGQVEPIISLAFMEIPFPYDGGNENFGGTQEQFLRASQRNTGGNGGRINSFFDHYLPLYPAPKDPAVPGGKEPAEDPIGGKILIFAGDNSPYYNYSGHPGYDYSTFVPRKATTPLFAAADGIIADVGEHKASGALYVKINHEVVGVGTFQTIYWHLEPDQFFAAMDGREGQAITAGTRLGTMGNTGWSTGHHLHFEVRFDGNQDGIFSTTEVVDPYGWTPSVAFPSDPWQQRTGLSSFYLWKHPMGVVAQIPDNGGGTVQQDQGRGGAGLDDETVTPVAAASSNQACAAPGTLPPGGQLYYSWAPDPLPNQQDVGIGHGCVLAAVDSNGEPVKSFGQPMRIEVPFSSADLVSVNPDTLKIYWKETDAEDWVALDTEVDLQRGLAVAFTTTPGRCSLRGQPLGDVVPPVTEIVLDGAQAGDGAFYAEVQVSLKTSDASEVTLTEYSLDGGQTWLQYSGPFTVKPGLAIPAPVDMDEEFFAGPPGTFLVLAASVDSAGNREEPPVMRAFSIDWSKDPQRAEKPLSPPTPTRSPTPTLSPTPGPSATPSPTGSPTFTPTETGCNVTLTLTKNAFCRRGPGTVYDDLTAYAAGTIAQVDGRNIDNTWWWILLPGQTAGHCWISSSLGTISGSEPSCLAVIKAPPTPTLSPTPVPSTPTFTPTPTRTPTPPPTSTPTTIPPPNPPVLLEPANGAIINTGTCEVGVSISWKPVVHPLGISHYEYYVEEDDDGVYYPHDSGSTTDTKVVVLAGCNKYRWKVFAVDTRGLKSGPSETWYYTLNYIIY